MKKLLIVLVLAFAFVCLTLSGYKGKAVAEEPATPPAEEATVAPEAVAPEAAAPEAAAPEAAAQE